jgi:antagonist of KipI
MAGIEVLEVVEPGLLTTVQDGGRPGLAGEGVSRGGAADPWSLAVANALVGNPPDAAALELTLIGPTLRVLRAVTVGLAGTVGGRALGTAGTPATVSPGAAVTLRPGEELHLDGAPAGARGYLSVPGGIDVPLVLGSRSTSLAAGFGGLDGRALRAGDRLRAGAGEADLEQGPRRWPGDPAPVAGEIRVLPGPHAATLGARALEALLAAEWTVSPASDRMGTRLVGPVIPGAPTGPLASLAVVPGTIQVPPDGAPIVLLVDHQPTGGYPVLAVVIGADLPALGQLAPGNTFRFAGSTNDDARHALDARRAAFEAARATLHDQEPWDDLWRWAR